MVDTNNLTMPTIFVTGTSAGIGEQISLFLLAQPSTKVIGVARRAAPESIATNPNYTHIIGDLTDASTYSKIRETVGSKLDGAVFNAGVLDSVTKLEHTDMNAFRKVFEVNFFSVVELTRELIPALRATHGRAVYVSSSASEHPIQAWTAYGTSKAALNLMVSTLAVEEPDITALSIEPGVVDTSMQSLIRGNTEGMSEEDLKTFRSLKENKNLVSPEDIGKIFGSLALAAKHELTGKYLPFNDPLLDWGILVFHS